MSKSDKNLKNTIKKPRAVALSYDNDHGAPVIVASGMGHMAEKIVEVANDNGVPVYEDNSLATVLSQLELGKQIPQELYNAIVEIYIYFLSFDPNDPEKHRRERQERLQNINSKKMDEDEINIAENIAENIAQN